MSHLSCVLPFRCQQIKIYFQWNSLIEFVSALISNKIKEKKKLFVNSIKYLVTIARKRMHLIWNVQNMHMNYAHKTKMLLIKKKFLNNFKVNDDLKEKKKKNNEMLCIAYKIYIPVCKQKTMFLSSHIRMKCTTYSRST